MKTSLRSRENPRLRAGDLPCCDSAKMPREKERGTPPSLFGDDDLTHRGARQPNSVVVLVQLRAELGEADQTVLDAETCEWLCFVSASCHDWWASRKPELPAREMQTCSKRDVGGKSAAKKGYWAVWAQLRQTDGTDMRLSVPAVANAKRRHGARRAAL